MVVGAIVVFKFRVPFYSLIVHTLWTLDALIDDSLSKSSVNTFNSDTVREGINRKFL